MINAQFHFQYFSQTFFTLIMKNIFLATFLFFGILASAQTHQLVLHNGIVQNVNFIKQNDSLLFYSDSDSHEQKLISAHAVAYLKNLKTKEQIDITSKTVINDKKEYLKVTLFDHEDQVQGLKVVDSFNGYLNKAKGISKWEQYENTERIVRYHAATKGYPFVFIIKNANGSFKAIAYNY